MWALPSYCSLSLPSSCVWLREEKPKKQAAESVNLFGCCSVRCPRRMWFSRSKVMRWARRTLQPSRDALSQPRNFFDTTMRAVSLRTLFAGTRRSHGRSNCKFDATLGLLNLWQKAKPGWRRAAHVAHLVEHVLGKDEVTGSIPVMGSEQAQDRQQIIKVKQDSLVN